MHTTSFSTGQSLHRTRYLDTHSLHSRRGDLSIIAYSRPARQHLALHSHCTTTPRIDSVFTLPHHRSSRIGFLYVFFLSPTGRPSWIFTRRAAVIYIEPVLFRCIFGLDWLLLRLASPSTTHHHHSHTSHVDSGSTKQNACISSSRSPSFHVVDLLRPLASHPFVCQ